MSNNIKNNLSSEMIFLENYFSKKYLSPNLIPLGGMMTSRPFFISALRFTSLVMILFDCYLVPSLVLFAINRNNMRRQTPEPYFGENILPALV